MDGIRKSLAEEFSQVFVINLRGDIRKNMLSKGAAKEGQNIFESGSMAGISISIFVKNPHKSGVGEIYYHDIGDDLNRDQKLNILESHSFGDWLEHEQWKLISPNQHADWIGQRDESFHDFMLIGSKRPSEPTMFSLFSNGVVSNRDPWVYSFSKTSLEKHLAQMVDFYNEEVDRYENSGAELDSVAEVQAFVTKDESRISWGGSSWQSRFAKKQKEKVEAELTGIGLYRPFTKMWHYGAKTFNHSFYSMPKVFPNASSENFVICISGVGARSGFSALMANAMPNLHTLDTGLCFPLHIYDEPKKCKVDRQQSGLFASSKDPDCLKRCYAITDEGLAHFQSAYLEVDITKEDLFYYVYGLLHSMDYRERYADNLSKELPRIPRVKTVVDFRAFSQSGRDLAELHLNYETVPMYTDAKIDTGGTTLSDADYRVEKMKFPKKGKDKDLTTLIYNSKITVTGIPLDAYDYIVNGKPALDWVVERQSVKTDKASGVVNDANDWAIETVNNPRYPLELFLRVITVSLETMKIVRALPPLDIRDDG